MEGDPESGTLRVINQRDGNGRTALHLAARDGQEDVAKLLMETSIQSYHEAEDKDGITALHLAAQNGRVGLMRFVVNAWKGGILKEDNKGRTPSKLPSKEGHSEVVRTLLESAAEFDHIGEVLREAAQRGFEEVCELWIKRLGDVDWPDENMQTALHHAAFGGHHEVIQFLVDCGANTEAEDGCSNTPLRLAAFENKTKATNILLRSQRQKEREYNQRSNQRRNEKLARSRCVF